MAGGELQLAQHRGHVALHRLRRNEQLLGDLLVGVALGDQPEHLALPAGQLVELGVEGGLHVARRLGRRRERVQHEPGQPVREHRVARGDPADRVGQLGGGDRLGHVTPGPGPDHRDHVLRGVRGGQREKPYFGMRSLDRLHHGLAAATGQVHVEQHHVRQQLADQVDRGLHVVRLTDDLDLPAELSPDPGPEQPVVVDQHHPGGFSAHVRPAGRLLRGIFSVTLVPSPGAVVTVAVPPRRVIRPCTDSARPLRSSGTASGSKPFPRSRTTIDTSPGSTSANSEMTPASDHLAALTVASPAAASSAVRLSSRSQSPTVTASTGTPYLASTSCWSFRTPAATVSSSSAWSGSRPSNSQERSSRSCIRASWMTFCGSSARRWISASVCSTESCTRAAMSTRSSARALAWRSSARSRAIRSHQGPRASTMAAITSSTPPSGRSSARLACAENSQPSPPAISAPAMTRRNADRRFGRTSSVATPSGSSKCRSVAWSSSGAFRQISASPAMLNTCGEAQPMNQPPLSAPATSSTKMSSEARPTASRMPPASVLALLKMLASVPVAGMNSQASTYSGTPQPVGLLAAQRATVTSVPFTQPERTVAPEWATVPRLVAVPAVRILHRSIMA